MENLIIDQLLAQAVKFTQQLDKIEAMIRDSRLPEPALDKLLTVQEAADFLNLTVPTIYSKVSRGELPYMKRSKRLYFSRQELTAYLKAGRVKTTAEIQAEAGTYLK